MESEGFPVVSLQGNLSQKARERAMADFRSGAMPILVATNVAARGIDVADVGQVINFEVPESAELFTHRVGRTGRMGKSGEAITFVTPDEAPKWRQIERALGKTLPRQPWTEDGAPSSTPSPALGQRHSPVRPHRSRCPPRLRMPARTRPGAARAGVAAPARSASRRRGRASERFTWTACRSARSPGPTWPHVPPPAHRLNGPSSGSREASARKSVI